MKNLFSECSLVALVGPMGSGKTEFVSRLRDENGLIPFFLNTEDAVQLDRHYDNWNNYRYVVIDEIGNWDVSSILSAAALARVANKTLILIAQDIKQITKIGLPEDLRIVELK